MPRAVLRVHVGKACHSQNSLRTSLLKMSNEKPVFTSKIHGISMIFHESLKNEQNSQKIARRAHFNKTLNWVPERVGRAVKA